VTSEVETGATTSSSRPVRVILQNRNFRLLWLAGLMSYVGNWSLFAALPLFVFQLTGSAFASGVVLTAMFLPLLLGSVAGVFVDRWDRQRTLLIGNLAMAVLVLPMLITATGHGLWVAYVVVIFVGLASQFTTVAENALLPRLVGREHLLAANSLNSLNDNLGRIIGPALGGLVATGAGLTGVVIMNAACYLVAAGLIGWMKIIPQPDADTEQSPPEPAVGLLTEWRSGIAVIFRSRVLAIVFGVCAVFMLADSVLSALLAPFVATEVSSAAWTFGGLLALRGVGGLLGGVLTGLVGGRLRPATALGTSLVAVGLLSFVFVNISEPVVAYATIALMGVLVIPGMAGQQTLLQTNADDQLLGRVFGALGTTMAVTMLIGSLAGGALAQVVGVVPLLNVAAVLYTLAGVLALVLLRQVRSSETDRPTVR
jgi:predicted MFS family arabinose efflux permease